VELIFPLGNGGLNLFRIGNGYDVHKLVENRKLILGGVEIPYEKGLLGHSDADVLIHAIMDAMLGALALGDIGQHFPDTDSKYKGISSIKLLSHVMELISNKGYEIVNIDSQIVMQQPKLKPHIIHMRENLSKVLNTSLENVSVKATTEEKLGFTGDGSGVKSYAVVLLKKISI
jgi:2-C-methyl-D-erythritol 2,4-cyclodiphosphate synthase